MIPFAPWVPDQADLNINVSKNVSGVLPLPNGYGPWRTFSPYATALSEAPLGAAITRREDGTRHVWCGTTIDLLKLNRSTLAFDDVSRTVGGSYACGANDRWNFIQFGTTLIAHNSADVTQSIDIEAGTNFAALAGSPPQAKYGAVVGEFVMLGNLASAPNKLHWSAINDSTGWTVGTSQSDTQEFPDGGAVTGVVGGETGLVFQEECVRRLTYIGDPLIFQIDKIEDKRGLKAPFSIARMGTAVFYYSPEGFAVISTGGNESRLLGTDQNGQSTINEWFVTDSDASKVNNIRGIADPLRSRVFWLYKSSNTANTFDSLLCYSVTDGRWTVSRGNFTELCVAATAGYTLDNMNALGTLETLTVSLDDPSLKGDVPSLAAFNGAYRLGFFSGTNQEATIETGEVELVPGRRAFVRGFKPHVDTATCYVSVGSRRVPSDMPTYSGESQPHSETGIAPFRVDSRYHRFKVRIPSGTAWTKAIGGDPTFVPTGGR